MATPNDITDLSTTAGSNSPAGSETPSVLDDIIRAHGAIIKQNVSKGSDITSAGTLSVPDVGCYFDVTVGGVTTITGLSDSWSGRVIFLQFDGALTLTDSASLNLFGSNITTAAGDVLCIGYEGSSIWRAVSFFAASGSLSWAGITATAAEINYNDLTTGPGTSEASKSLVLDASSNITAGTLNNLTAAGTVTAGTVTDGTASLNGGDLSGATLDTATVAVTQSDWDNSTKIATTAFVEAASSYQNMVYLEERQTAGTNAGSITANTWTDRVLNTEVFNNIAGSTHTSGTGEIELPAGKYWVEGLFACTNVDSAIVQLYNVTDATTALIGMATYAKTTGQTAESPIRGLLTVVSTKTYKIQHITESTNSVGTGKGFSADIAISNANVPHETYGQLKIVQVSD